MCSLNKLVSSVEWGSRSHAVRSFLELLVLFLTSSGSMLKTFGSSIRWLLLKNGHMMSWQYDVPENSGIIVVCVMSPFPSAGCLHILLLPEC